MSEGYGSNYKKYTSLTVAYDILIATRDGMQKIKEQIQADFKPADSLHFSNPFSYKHNLADEVKEARADFTKFVIGYVGQDYLKKNIELDRHAILNFVEQKGYFNALEIIGFINTKYADVDAEALKQIKEIVKGKMLPNGNKYNESGTWATAYKPEHIRMENNSAGLELRVWGSDENEKKRKVSALLKLITITLNGTKPSLVQDTWVEQGATYHDAKIKSLRYFKNHSLKLVFYTKPDADKVIEAIL